MSRARFDQGLHRFDGVLGGVVLLAGEERQGDPRGERGQDMAEHVARALRERGEEHQGIQVAGPAFGGDRRAGLVGPGDGEVGPLAQGDHAELAQVEIAPVVAVEQEDVGGLKVLGHERPVARGQCPARVLALAAEVHA